MTTTCYRVLAACALVALVQLAAVSASPWGYGYGNGGQQQQQQQNNQNVGLIDNLTSIRINNYTSNSANGQHIRHKRDAFKPGNRVCIKSKAYNEYLYAAQDNYAMDSDRRRVYTWIPGDKDEQMVFKFENVRDNEYYIKSVYFDEYLYATDNYRLEGYGDRRPGVFTWRKKHETVGYNGRWTVYKEAEGWLLFNFHTSTYLYADFNQKTEGTRRHVATLAGKSADAWWHLEAC